MKALLRRLLVLAALVPLGQCTTYKVAPRPAPVTTTTTETMADPVQKTTTRKTTTTYQ